MVKERRETEVESRKKQREGVMAELCTRDISLVCFPLLRRKQLSVAVVEYARQ